ncbi:LysR family transcriptional regulator [Nonomuraea sp. NPDC050783]|uniref:LysR family transcriptional regulator n=1 Tax=Nonomuraea sp. NPDC050783 TaxID=3154634 RepID=UPI0034666FF1
MIELLDLQVFAAVVEHGSFSKAAASLGYTQPAISQRIARLETALGRTTLLDRSRRGRIQVTPPGEVVLRYATSFSIGLKDLEREVSELAGPAAGNVHVIAFPTAAATILPAAVADFRSTHPRVNVHITEAEPQLAFPRLLDGRADIVVGYTYPSVNAPGHPRVPVEDLFHDPMAVALPITHALADRQSLTLEDLRHELWVTPRECPCRQAVVQACRAAGYTPVVVSETNDYMAMQGLVASGVGVALMPRLVAEIAVHPRTVLRPLVHDSLTRVVTLAARPTGYRPPACEPMLEALRQVVGAMPVLAQGGSAGQRPRNGCPRGVRASPLTASEEEAEGSAGYSAGQCAPSGGVTTVSRYFSM